MSSTRSDENDATPLEQCEERDFTGLTRPGPDRPEQDDAAVEAGARGGGEASAADANQQAVDMRQDVHVEPRARPRRGQADEPALDRSRHRTECTRAGAVWLAWVFVLALSQEALAWGSLGHQAIAEAAQRALTPAASAGLARVFGQGDAIAPGTLARAATWPDEIRIVNAGEPPPAWWDASDTREAEAFNADHKGNPAWHFVNLPLGARAYPQTTAADDPLRAFVRDDDIVHVLRRCIRILELPNPAKSFTRVQAVRWLVHLVGDVHQPLHVTSGYYRSSRARHPLLIRDPVVAREPGVVGDRGGNGLLFPSGNNLHATWDGCLVDRASGQPCGGARGEYTPLARLLAARMSGEGVAFKSTGDHLRWPEQWATDSLHAAVEADAYPTRLAHGSVRSPRGGDGRYLETTIVSPTNDAYVATHVRAAERQLVKAAVRLADVLNAIVWR